MEMETVGNQTHGLDGLARISTNVESGDGERSGESVVTEVLGGRVILGRDIMVKSHSFVLQFAFILRSSHIQMNRALKTCKFRRTIPGRKYGESSLNAVLKISQ